MDYTPLASEAQWFCDGEASLGNLYLGPVSQSYKHRVNTYSMLQVL